MVRTLGLLTLGQAPRLDVTPSLRRLLGPRVRIVERGGLDGFTGASLAALAARDGEAQVETRLASGAAFAVRRAALLARLVEAGQHLAATCDLALLLCSGEFPALAEACPGLVQPIHILRGVVRAVAADRVLGIIGPASDMAEAPEQWRPYAPRVVCAAASPYQRNGAAAAAGRAAAGLGAQVILLDDMGFNDGHRKAVARAANLPVLCASTLTARALKELL